MKQEQAESIFLEFIKEDERLFLLPETENTGNPFTICTNGARWLKKKFFPNNSKVVGYSIANNPNAEIGQATYGHDFLLIDNRYILDFWYRHVVGKRDCPILIDIETQSDIVKKYYGDSKTWVDMK